MTRKDEIADTKADLTADARDQAAKEKEIERRLAARWERIMADMPRCKIYYGPG